MFDLDRMAAADRALREMTGALPEAAPDARSVPQPRCPYAARRREDEPA